MPRRSRPLIGRNTAASRRYRNAIAIETPLQSETRRALRRLRYSEARVVAAKTMQVPVQRIQLWTHKPFSGLQYNTHIDYKADSSVDIGQMSRVCQFCSALRFRDEPFGLCCKQGRVSLLAIESPPEPIFSLLSGLHPLSKSFLLHIRRYNSIFQMTSFGARQVVTVNMHILRAYMNRRRNNTPNPISPVPTEYFIGGLEIVCPNCSALHFPGETVGPFCYRIHGQIYLLTGPLHPNDNRTPSYAQLYISDSEAANNIRIAASGPLACHPPILTLLDSVLRRVNPYTSAYRQMLQFEKDEEQRARIENRQMCQSPSDRPDLVARVFNLKLQQLLHEIVNQHVLGVVIARVHVIEEEDKPRDRDVIDKFVCAEIPSPTMQVQLYDMVCKHMIHGPCGNFNIRSPCMSDGKCTKDFPKSFLQLTEANNNGYPRYGRRDDGQTLVVGIHKVDNCWVVPYTPNLLVRFNANINVEVCASVKSVKYLFEYVYKGHDRAQVEVTVGKSAFESRTHDEIKSFLDARYVSAPEEMWRMFEYRLHAHPHTICRLAVHLPTFQQNQWHARVRGGALCIGRMCSVNPKNSERYHLRLLLLHVAGSQSLEDLRTVDDIVCSTFEEAAQRRGLLADHSDWDACLAEAALLQMPCQLRRLFATILIFNNPNDPGSLWTKYKGYC
ncbi:hypothetical protein LAZ67_11001589 [Cordylochernes scorpioides]|uniref:Helitron helicase-like domain-containing protein n=1 Tax=Cordylochernes scorpioides TaxID=51811 RepID=A0ABY6KZ16_9ARAC|nr:hypothetical protein LAZ67_11001589 [Cordylochernes scorpioides]